MVSFLFNSETLGSIGDTSRAVSDIAVEGEGADEIVQHVGGAFVEAFARGNRQASISFMVQQQYGTFAEAFEEIVMRAQRMAQLATFEIAIDISGVSKTLRMVNALRGALKGEQTGISVAWSFSFTGGRFVEVAAPPGSTPDYAGGECNSGDTFTRFYWGGTCGDGAPNDAGWKRSIEGGVV